METINKIVLGDSYKLIKEIADSSVDLIITDPPYQIESLTGGGMLKEKRMVNLMDELGSHGLDVGIDEAIFPEFMRIMKKPNIYIWCNLKLLPKLIKYFVEEQGCNFNLIVWNKTNAMPLCGGKYLNDCEYCAYFYKGIKLNTTYDTAKTVYYKPININDKNDYGHPNCKPLDIIQNMIINSSSPGDLVFDAFSGSGTTSIAAKMLGRHSLAFEIDEEYYRISCDRVNGINQKGEMDLFSVNYEQLDLFGGNDNEN